MGIAIHLVAGSATTTDVANAVDPFTAGSGDTFSVRNFAPTATASLEFLAGDYAAENVLRVRSPALHDVEQAIHAPVEAANPQNLLPASDQQLLQAQDLLTVELVEESAVAAETEVAVLGIYYSDLPGASARLHLPGDIKGNIKYIRMVKVSVGFSAVAGEWASATLDSTEDIWHANSDYAILGYISESRACAVAIHGDETSNYKVGGPGTTDQFLTRDYFWDMAEKTQTPHIPVVNAANRGSTYVDVVGRTVAGTDNVYLVTAELAANLAS